jgi:hypothetical protein
MAQSTRPSSSWSGERDPTKRTLGLVQELVKSSLWPLQRFPGGLSIMYKRVGEFPSLFAPVYHDLF